MCNKTIEQKHSGSGDNVKEKNIDDKSVSAKGDIIGAVVTGNGNIVTFVKNNHIALEDYDMSKSDIFYQLFAFDDKNINDMYIEPIFEIKYYLIHDCKYKEQKVNKLFLDTIQELIENKSMIYIVGKYGVGKSILLKKIYNFLGTTYDIYFLDIKQLMDKQGDREFVVCTSDKTKIFIIDGLDELNIDNKRFRTLVRDILRLANYAEIKFIFGTRLYIDGNEDLAYGLIGDNEDLIRDIEIPFIEIDYFTKQMIEAWLEHYYPNDDKMELTLKDMENVDKRLFSLSQIPIFLYQVALHFYNENIEVLEKEKIYDIYKTFITKTVKGKFATGIHSTIEYEKKYKAFLMKVAAIIFERNYEKNNFSKYTANLNTQSLEKKFTIEHKKVKEIISNMDSGIIGGDIEKVNNAINCYFFEKINDYDWMFSNTNILLYLVSEYYFGILEQWIQDIDIPEDFKFYIDKTIFEYLIQLLKSNENQNKYSRLIEKIELTINFDNELTDFEYHMGIIYIFYDGGNPKISLILDKLFTYSKRKYDDRNYLYLLYSSFQSINLENIEFRDFNFSNFNFSHSQLKNVIFKGCTFSKETIFNFVGFDDVCFDYCTIKDTKIVNNVYSNMSFLNCTLNGVHMKNIKEGLIKIEGENSKIVRLELHNFSKPANIQFINIKHGQALIVKENDKVRYQFTNTAFDKVNLTHSAIYLQKENCELGIQKDGSSKIIHE